MLECDQLFILCLFELLTTLGGILSGLSLSVLVKQVECPMNEFVFPSVSINMSA